MPSANQVIKKKFLKKMMKRAGEKYQNIADQKI
jgi:hypothetical protein